MRIGIFAPANYLDPGILYSGPSLGLPYISAYLKQQFGELIEEFFLEVDIDLLIERKPDLIGISSFSYAYGQAIEGAIQFKAQLPGVPIIVGGPHISALPVNLHPAMDIGVIGEGEVPMRDLVGLFLRNELTPEKLKEVSGIIYWNEKRELEYSGCAEKRIDVLDMLPLPDRAIMHAYSPLLGEEMRWEQSLCTSRGCPFTCRFCMYSKTANLVRYHSVDNVIEDIVDVMRRYPKQYHIRINDDLFVTKKPRLKELADRIREEKIHQKVTFGCMAKASFFDEDYCRILKSMNITGISFGFESNSNPILQYLKDKSSTDKKNQRAIDLCSKYGISVGGYFILGSPPETKVDLARTYWFIHKNIDVMSSFGLFPLQAHPGTEVWQNAKDKGLIDENFNNYESFAYKSIEKDNYLYMNENYTFEFLRDVYLKHFNRLKVPCNNYLKIAPYQNLLIKPYYENLIYPSVRKNFKSGQRLLEIQRGERALTYMLEDDYALTSVHWSELARLSETEFDGIILNHTLEKFGIDSPQWQQLQTYNCPILVVIENAATLPKLLALLTGQGLPYDGLYQYDNRSFYTLNNLLNQTLKDFNSLDIQRNRLPQFSEADIFAGLEDQLALMTSKKSSELYSFNLLLHMLQPTTNSPVLALLRQYLPIETFMKEAEVFSYSVLLQPISKESSEQVLEPQMAIAAR